jgi:hypothetical protein
VPVRCEEFELSARPNELDPRANLCLSGPPASRATILMEHHVDVDLADCRAKGSNRVATFDGRTEPIVQNDLDVLSRETRQADQALTGQPQSHRAFRDHAPRRDYC